MAGRMKRGMQLVTIVKTAGSKSVVVRQGVLRVRGCTAEYSVLQPAPTQWVVMALVQFRAELPRQLVVTEGCCEEAAVARLETRLSQSSASSADSAFVTEWAMSLSDA
jgi:hypothetical protein